MPCLGRTPRALLAIADIGERISSAGVDVSAEVARLPGGLNSLGPTNGQIPLDWLGAVAPAVHRARISVDVAVALAERLPSSWLLGPVAAARNLVTDRLDQIAPLARSADALLHSMPAFAGQDGPKRYFVDIQNTTEFRGTGGLIGNYAILTLDHGRMSLSPFRDARELANLRASDALSPSRDFTDLYGPFGGGGFWLNLNMTPDAPTAAILIESLYQQVQDQHLDGTIFFDLEGLSDMLRATGPVNVPAIGETLTADNVIGSIAASSYLQSSLRDPFSEGPRLIAEAVWTRFLRGTKPQGALRTLVSAAGSGHPILHSADPAVESAFREADVSGDFGTTGSDFFSAVLTNAAANKVAYFLQRDIRYAVTLGPGGTGHADATVRFTNHAPADAPPSYSLGPSGASKAAHLHLVAGEDRAWAQFYCAPGCQLTGSTEDGGPFPVELHHEKGLPLYANFVDILPQRSRTVSLSFAISQAWEGDGAAGTYRLSVPEQTTPQPTTGTIVIQAPSGMGIAWTNVPMRITGTRAVWAGRIDRKLELVVHFQHSFLGRIWARIWGFLDRPVAHL